MIVNEPYVKKYNKNEDVINPIQGSYLHQFDNRKTRRHKEPPFIGNGRSFPLTVYGKYKYMRAVQLVLDKTGNSKKIYHYLPC